MKKKSMIYQLTVCALMAALMCVVGPLTIPIGPVPITLANLVICLAACLLGWKWSSVSVVVYVLLGTVGLPVFSGFSGGLAKLAGPTGGYIVGFVFISLIGGLFIEKFRSKIPWTIVGLILGTLVTYAFGTVWFVIQMECDLWYALTICVFPFVVVDLAKIIFASIVGGVIRKALIREHLIEDKYGEVS